MKRKLKIKGFLKVFVTLLFIVLVPFAIYYNQHYDRFGSIWREPIPVFITVVSVDADRYVGTFKLTAAEYSDRNESVKIFVMPLKSELIHNVDFSIAIVSENGILHAFVSKGMQSEEKRHCTSYLEKLKEKDGILLSVKDA